MKTMIPLKTKTKKELRRLCKLKGVTYDFMVNEMMTYYLYWTGTESKSKQKKPKVV